MAIWRTNVPPSKAESMRPRHSVRFIQLQLAPIYRRPPTQDASAPPASRRDSTTTHREAAAPNSSLKRATAEQSAATAEKGRPDPHRQFKLPPNVQVQPVKQTLVEMDLPPTITFTEEIPLPTMLLWTKTAAPPMRRQFIAPPQRTEVPRVTQSLPAAPALSLPNQEVNPTDLNMAALIPTEAPHLVHPTGVASPVTRTGEEPAKEIPQIGLAKTADAHPVNLISVPANLSRSSGMVVLPPANQIAASDATAAGSPNGSGNGTGAGEQGTVADGSSTPGGLSKKSGTDSSSAVATNTAAASAGSGAWSASGSSLGNILPGTTRIELPKEGQYGVVVLGSASATPYPESVGALSGKMIYTVYLKVGFRKTWILQYCLPGAAKEQSGASGKSVSTVLAPWPFVIMRPDHPDPTDPEYIIVHGMITDAGKFDQLALVFPNEFDKKELLMQSLKLWAFRPASRDGVRVPVEALLIIPRETE